MKLKKIIKKMIKIKKITIKRIKTKSNIKIQYHQKTRTRHQRAHNKDIYFFNYIYIW
jgi:hypothetical protein